MDVANDGLAGHQEQGFVEVPRLSSISAGPFTQEHLQEVSVCVAALPHREL